ncbi:alpha/beta fold hydrolase [Mesorhizobium sp. M00.F.Ca.ET.186.01.1.1]|nr:alpha/beta fold hydrolase [bacterium M00.F.Ca.ET.205.01.1.1]TGU50396.1 alpha/beta fold hydrolase [bacterium M00.F.Ca.ET.152.01.1.1]TGV34111.1 alpha/beta fold hydrolase [Mesorhizobium sp. M00.F.Ca.ET.186.01.1.1]TGZ40760.1 alpha/beta fold hydrolase [bacterium M00.F.Ca.ET.162.01.1.1]
MERLQLRLLGFPEFRVDGRRIELALRKAAALVIYLAEAGGPVARDVAATLLWPEADAEAARARLRRTLYKIRIAFGAEVISASATSLMLRPPLFVEADSRAFDHACDAGLLTEAADLYRGDYLAGFSMPDCPEFEEWAFFRREALRSRLVQVLERLVDAKIADGEPRDAVVHATRLAALDPLSESAHRHLIRAHLAAGDRAAAERQGETCTRLLRDELGIAPDPATLALLREPKNDAAPDVPRTRYVEVDGIHIAYQTIGDGPADIVLVPGFISHVERIWEDRNCRAWLTDVSRLGRLILFDRRGMGLSDRVGARPTVEATAQDILAVMNAAGSRRALLIGASEGGPGCIHFAFDHPDRLNGLILWGSLAKGSHAPDYPFALTTAQYALWQRRLLAGWGSPAEIETFAPSVADDRQARAWWAGLLRAASSPGAVAGLLEALRDADVRPLLSKVSAPTMVLHRTADRAVRIEAGRYLAARIPGARFVEVRGDDHWFWVGEQQVLLEAIGAMVRGR